MNDLTLDELEQIATQYESLMVPALFEPWAERVLDVADVKPGDRVLDVACGTGAVARAAANRTGSTASVAGLDMNPGMLSVARTITPGIKWKEGTAEELPYDDNTFDVVVSQFGLMFFQDQKAALQEMERVLVPGGRSVVAVFDSLDRVPGYRVLTQIFGRVAGEDVAQALRFPFSLGDTEDLRSLCTEGGLSSAKISTHDLSVRFPDVRTMVLADVKGWFPLAGIELDDEQINSVVQAAEQELEEFIAADGSLTFPMPAHFIVTQKVATNTNVAASYQEQ